MKVETINVSNFSLSEMTNFETNSFKVRSFARFQGLLIDACAARGGPGVNQQYEKRSETKVYFKMLQIKGHGNDNDKWTFSSFR